MGGNTFSVSPPDPSDMGGKQKFSPQGGQIWGENTRSKYIQKRTCAAGENFGDWWVVTSAPQAKILVFSNTEMRFPKGKSMIWGSDFSKKSLPPPWLGNPVEISKFFPPYGGKILKIIPPHPSGVGGKIVRFFPPSLSDMGGEKVPISAKTPHMGGKNPPLVWRSVVKRL